MSVVVLDEDLASSLLRRHASDALSRHLSGQVPAVTFVTLGELPLATFNTQDFADFAEHEGLLLLP